MKKYFVEYMGFDGEEVLKEKKFNTFDEAIKFNKKLLAKNNKIAQATVYKLGKRIIPAPKTTRECDTVAYINPVKKGSSKIVMEKADKEGIIIKK